MIKKSKPVFEPLGKGHERNLFSCGVPVLDDYIKKQAGQDRRRQIAFTYVMLLNGENAVWAFYTLSATSVPVMDLPEKLARQTPYQVAPAALLGRLAVDESIQGKGYGQAVLIDALRRIAQMESMAVMMVVVDPKDQQATEFYSRYGFKPLEGEGGRMYLPFKTIKSL